MTLSPSEAIQVGFLIGLFVGIMATSWIIFAFFVKEEKKSECQK